MKNYNDTMAREKGVNVAASREIFSSEIINEYTLIVEGFHCCIRSSKLELQHNCMLLCIELHFYLIISIHRDW